MFKLNFKIDLHMFECVAFNSDIIYDKANLKK